MSIKHIVLGILEEEPAGAYSLKQTIDEWTAGTWSINIGQVSQTLSRLERDGFVEPAGEVAVGGRVTELYAITPEGKAELGAWWSTPVAKSPRDRDELVMRVLAAMRSPHVDVGEVIQHQRRHTVQALAAATKELRELGGEDVATYLILQRRIFDLDSESRWLDHIERAATRASVRKEPS